MAGVLLPMLLALWYTATDFIPHLAISAPKYDVLYLTNYADNAPNTLHVEVVDSHLVAMFIGDNFGYGWPQLFRFHSATGVVEEIPIIPPKNLPIKRPNQGLANNAHVPVIIPPLQSLRLDTSSAAPDGYIFKKGDNTADIFSVWDDSDKGFAYIYHGAKEVLIPPPAGNGQPRPKFLGWIIP